MTRLLTFADFDLNSSNPELTLPSPSDLQNVTVQSIIDFDALLAGTNSLYSFSGVSLGRYYTHGAS